MSIRTFLVLLFAVFLTSSCTPTLVQAQDVSGMTGIVTDASGAIVPDVTVVLTNTAKGLKFTQTTNSSGSYRFSNVPPGPGYEAMFTASGFAPVDIKDIYLTVATVRTQNVPMSVSSAEVHVEVTASNSEVTIDTNDATIGNTFDANKLNDLPVQQRNDPTALFTMQPGVTDQGSTTGARTDQNEITLDGLDVVDLATGGAVQNNSGITQGFQGAIVGHAPIDSVQEFHATVGGFGSDSGPGSGGQFQLVTKSGTNQWHGNVNEYHRDPLLVANGWFANNATPIVPRNHLIQNQFGGNVGGPVLKNKLYFFFNYLNSSIIRSQLTFRTVPLDSLRAGNITYINSSGGNSFLTPAQVKALDPAGIGESQTFLNAFNSRFPHSNATGGDGLNSGGFNFNAPDNDNQTNYVGRVDYNINANMKAFARFTISRENATQTLNEFPNDPPSAPFIDRTYAFVIGHNWVIGSNKTNRAFVGETVEKFAYPLTFNPDGSTWLTFGDGTTSSLTSTFYLQPNSQSRRIPVPEAGDDFTWSKGNHTWQMGGTFKDILAKYNNVSDFNSVEEGMGGHVFSLCGPNPNDCGTGVPSLRPANINTSANFGTTPYSTYDEAFAFMLGRIGNIMSDFNYNVSGTALPQLTGDQRIYRYYQTELYAADTWKVLPSLTLSYGFNYQIFSVPYETRGLQSTEPLTYNQYMSDRVKQSNASITGPTAVPLITYILGGKANNGPPLISQQYNNIAPRFAFAWNPDFDKKTVFNGGIGMVYDRTIINAIQAIQDVDSYLFQQSGSISEGNGADPYNSIKNDPRLDKNSNISTVTITPPATPKPPYQPFVAGGVPYGLQLGSAFNETIDPSLKTPYSIALNAGMQTQLPGDMVMKLSYAGRLGRRLLAQADANQVLEFPDPASGQLYSAAFAAVSNQLRAGVQPGNVTPQPWFENLIGPGLGVPKGTATQTLAKNFGPFIQRGDIGDITEFLSNYDAYNIGSAAQFSENTFFTNKGSSSYNALLFTLQKNLSHGLQFDFNYTFAHSIDNVSFFANSQGDTGIGGVGLICDDVRPRECRANSDFDVTHYITGDETYQLPFGRHRTFLAGIPLWEEELIGGWDISGVTEWHTGIAWGNNANAFDAGYSNDAPGILIGSPAAVATHLTKIPGGGVNVFNAVPSTPSQPYSALAAASAYEGPIGFQVGPRNSLRGPRYFNQDLGLAKTFPLYRERVNAKFRADAFNAFNHPNFDLPIENVYNGFDNQDFTNPSFGQITDTISPAGNLNNGARVLQVSLRIEF